MSGVDRDTCCRHCVDGCEGWGGGWDHAAQRMTPPIQREGDVTFAVWQDDCCPMCAEAVRITAAIQLAAHQAPHGGIRQGLIEAADIAAESLRAAL